MLKFCPFGGLVEEYPLHDGDTHMSCEVFGHDCPIFYQAEMFSEDTEPTEEDFKKCYDELSARAKKCGCGEEHL
jgi:hypothetical protein